MAKKVDKPVVIAENLIIRKDEFEKQINDRITKGKNLLTFSVGHSIEYDETEKNNFFSEYKKWNRFNIELLEQSFDISNNKYKKEYEGSTFHFILGSDDTVKTQKEDIQKKITVLESFLDILSLIPTTIETTNDPTDIAAITFSKNEVFIVHGHDNSAKTETARFIEKLGLKPIILHEQVNSGKTIIEKIEEYSNVGFGIVLYTPCDKGCKNGEESNLSNRARQNVVFEHGFLIGKIGRKNVCALVKETVETPNDISGVVYITMDTNEAWRLEIAKELNSSGYDIDLNKLL